MLDPCVQSLSVIVGVSDGVTVQGLDSTTAMHLLQLLRQLSQGGRAIVTTIHQPSSRLYQQLDKLLLLSQVCIWQMPFRGISYLCTAASFQGETPAFCGISFL